VNQYRVLLDLSQEVFEDLASQREKLASTLAAIPLEPMRPYLEISMRDEASVERSLLALRYGGVLKYGFNLLSHGKIEEVVALCTTDLAGATNLPETHFLFAQAVLRDVRVALWEAIELAIEHARKAVELRPSGDLLADCIALADAKPEDLALYAATGRASLLLDADRPALALFELWRAYPGHRGKPAAKVVPVSRNVQNLVPTGSPNYAFMMAQVIRQDVIQWFNVAKPQDRHAALELVRIAQLLMSRATAWALHARDRLASDPNIARTPKLEEVLKNIGELLQVIDNDIRALGR
jgi:hypothetical protein